MKITITEQQYRKLIVLNEQNRTEILKDKFVNSGKLTPEVFDKLIEGDPTNNKIYLQWIINQYVKIQNDKREEELFIEDLYKMNEYLELFDRLKNRFTYKDINQYKNYKEFIDNAINIKNSLSDKDLASGITKDDKTKEYQIGEVNGFKVYKIPKGRNDLYWISCLLGTGTDWCTATNKTKEHFERYIKDGPLYIFIRGKEKYEFHFESDQFKDKDDVEIFPCENYNKELYISFFEFLQSKENIQIPNGIKVVIGKEYDINQINVNNFFHILDRLNKNERLPFINKVIDNNPDFTNSINGDNIEYILDKLEKNERSPFINKVIKLSDNLAKTIVVYKIIYILYDLDENKRLPFIKYIIDNKPNFINIINVNHILDISHFLGVNEKSKLLNILTKEDDFNKNINTQVLLLILTYSKRPISLFKRLPKEKRLLINDLTDSQIEKLLKYSLNKESVTKLFKHYNMI